MTTTSIIADELHLIEQGAFRTDAISVHLDINYIDAQRWQITDAKVEAWITEDGHVTIKLIEPSPEIEAAIRHKIMTSKSWCEHISEHIASEMKQDRALQQPMNKWVMA